MLITKLLFIALIVICAAFYILYIWDFALVLLVIMIALPVLMFVYILTAKLMMTVDFALKDDTVAKGTPFPVQLCVVNKSIFPVGKAEAIIEYYNVFNNEINSFELHMPIQAHNTQRLTFRLSSQFCGMLRIHCRFIRIYDPLRLFCFKVGKKAWTQVAVLPEGREIGGTVLISDRHDEESELFSESRPGDDPSEVFDLRNYIPGDKLNRIHWKLSSKKDEFIVKDYSMPIDVPSVLLLDLKCPEITADTLLLSDTLIETLVSISQFMLENERTHTIVFYNSHTMSFNEFFIPTHEALSAAVRAIVGSLTDELKCEDAAEYLRDNTGKSLSSITFITSRTDHPAIECIDNDINADIKNAVIAVKDVNDIISSIQSYASVNVIPVVAGRISASIKDIEL